MDFDRSLKFPTDAPLDACRLPPEASLVSATPHQPPDLGLGEPDYDPFAFDVGCLGNMFRTTYADLVPVVPMLASLFDRMTTHVISERFKAAATLTFFEDATRHLPGNLLDMHVDLVPDWDYADNPSMYWAKVPPDFCPTPEIYRTPPLPLACRLLNVVVNYRTGWKILAFLRRVLRV